MFRIFKGILAALFLLLFSNQGFACGYNYIGDCSTLLFLDINETPDSFAVGHCTFGLDFDGYALGSIRSLQLAKVKGATWESCYNNVTSMQLRYRIYPTATPGGAWESIDLPEVYTTLEGPYTTRYRHTYPDLDLLAGLEIGINYTLEVFFQAEVDTTGDDFIPEIEHLQNNNGQNYRITFTNGGPAAPPFTVVATEASGVKCAGDSTGVAGVRVFGDQEGLFYNWGNGNNFFTQFNLPAGTYTVTVTGASGYAQTVSVEVESESNLQNTMTDLTPIACDGSPGSATASASGGVEPYHFAWNTGEQTATGHFPTSGLWWLTVTDAIGCSREFYANITGEPSGESYVSASICAGSQYLVGNQLLSEAGIYTVSLPGPGGCDSIVHLTLAVQNPGEALAGLAVQAEISCNEPTVELCAQSIPGTTFQWLQGGQTLGTGACFTASEAGFYRVVASLNNCTAQREVAVTANFQEPSGFGTGSGEINCGSDFVEIALEAFSTSGAASFQWIAPDGWTSDAATTTFTTNNLLQLDSLKLLITNAFGCTFQAPVQISINQNVEVPVVALNSLEPNCDGTWHGEIGISGGQAPYSVKWSDNSISGLQFDLPGGGYAVTVTGLNGCSIASSLDLMAYETLAASSSPGLVNCQNEVEITVLASGGFGAYSFDWSAPGASGSTIWLGEGSYDVTISDAQSCTLVLPIVVPFSEPQLFEIELQSANCSGPNIPDGTASVSVVNGSPALVFEWSNQASTPQIGNLFPGEYCVTVTDQTTGCTQTDCVQVGYTIDAQSIVKIETLKVSPNPARDQVQIELGALGSPWQHARIEIGAPNGQIWLRDNIAPDAAGRFWLEIGDLPPGVFGLRVWAEERVFSGKLVRI